MEWDDTIRKWVTHLRANRYPPTTIRTRTQHLLQLANEDPSTPPHAHTTETLLDWMGTHEWKPESWHAARTSLRGFYSWAHTAGLTPTNPAQAIPRARRPKPVARPCPDRVWETAWAAAPARERLMLRLAAQAGLRRGEVARVHTDDLLDDLTGWSLLVHGKGGKQRVVPLPDSLALDLIAHAGHSGGFVFPGRIDGHLSPQYVGDLISALMPPGWTMHTLRHRFGTAAYRVDRDVFTVQDLLGHASPETTRRYVQVSAGAARRTVLAVSSLVPGFPVVNP